MGRPFLGDARRRQLLGRAGVSASAHAWYQAGTGTGALPCRPEVDRLAIRVVTDSYHHAFEPTRKDRR
jgi:hypothetical protein